jgi:hypothetical protein
MMQPQDHTLWWMEKNVISTKVGLLGIFLGAREGTAGDAAAADQKAATGTPPSPPLCPTLNPHHHTHMFSTGEYQQLSVNTPVFCRLLTPPCHMAVCLQHIALTIGEEVDLHTRLLEELDEDVDVTHTRLRAATKRIRHVIKHNSNWKGGLCIFLLIIMLTLLLLVVFKVIKIFH